MLFVLLMACTGKPTDDTTSPRDDSLVLDPGFAVAETHGTAGGTVTGGVCTGWFPAAPQHVMTLNTTFTGLAMKLDTDTAMLSVTFDASTLCSDVEGGVHVLERGSWSQGDYDVYVGVAEEGAAIDYVLTVVEG